MERKVNEASIKAAEQAAAEARRTHPWVVTFTTTYGVTEEVVKYNGKARFRTKAEAQQHIAEKLNSPRVSDIKIVYDGADKE